MAVVCAQMVIVFNITALKVSIDGMAESLGTSASMVKSAIVVHAVVVAGFTLFGAKIGARFGWRPVFRGTRALFAAAMVMMPASRGALAMLVAQVASGAAAAALIPALVVLTASNYSGAQHERALGWLAAIQALSIVPAFLIAGALGAWLGWRYTFAVLACLAAAAYVMSDKLAHIEPRSADRIDRLGAFLMAAAVVLIGVGADKLLEWGVLRARPDAPFSWAAISPALLVIVCGVMLMKAFLSWERRCRASGRVPLLAPEIIGMPSERSALGSIFIVGIIGSGITFLIPLYIEVVQGRSSLYTAIAMIPFTVASFAGAGLVVRLQNRPMPYNGAHYGFLLVAAGVALLGAAIRNDWRDPAVMISMALAGLADGALAMHLFNVLYRHAPKQAAGDVEPLCGSASYLAVGVGTALAGALAIGVLGAAVQRDLVMNPLIPQELKAQVNLDKVSFVSNDRLIAVMTRTGATPEQVAEAVRINTNARLLALKVSFFALAACAFLAFFPARRIRLRALRESGNEPP